MTPTVAEPAPELADESATRRGPQWLPSGWRAHLVPILLLWLVAVAVVGSYMASSRTVSPMDEAAHLDYMVKMPEEFPAAGERMEDLTLEVWSCRDTPLEMELPPCDSDVYPPDHYPGGAYGLAGSHPPFYYLVTDVVCNAVHAVTPLDVLDSYRSVGVLWLGLALTTTYLLAISLSAPRSAAFGVTLMVAATSWVSWQSGGLGNDVASWFTGNLVILAAVRYQRRLPHTIILLAAAVLAAATKQTGFLAVGAAAFAIVLRVPLMRGAGRFAGWWRDWLAAVGAVVAFSVPSLAWTVYASAQATMDQSLIPQNQRFVVEGGIPLGPIVQQMFAFLTPISGTPPGEYLHSQAQGTMNQLVSGLLMLGVIVGVCVWRERPRLAALSVGVGVLLIVGGPMLAFANYVMSQSFFTLSSRYAFALLGVMAACAAAWLGERLAGRRAALACGIGLLALTLAQSDLIGLAQ